MAHNSTMLTGAINKNWNRFRADLEPATTEKYFRPLHLPQKIGYKLPRKA